MEDSTLKRTIGLFAAVFVLAGLTGCSSYLEKTMKDNPEILYNAIKAHPKEFLDTVNEAVELAKAEMQKQAMEEEFKNRNINALLIAEPSLNEPIRYYKRFYNKEIILTFEEFLGILAANRGP